MTSQQLPGTSQPLPELRIMKLSVHKIAEINSLISQVQEEYTNKMDDSLPTTDGDLMSYLATMMYNWTKEQQHEAISSVYNRQTSSPYYKLIVDVYQAGKHIKQTQTHQAFIMKTFNRLKEYFPTTTEMQLKQHDQSKYTFKQIIGYTKMFVHSCPQEDELWRSALKDHYEKEAHHPQHYRNENMPRKYLEESVIDMIACHWERDLHGLDTVNNYELANIANTFLNRYTVEDKKRVEQILVNIQMDSSSMLEHYLPQSIIIM